MKIFSVAVLFVSAVLSLAGCSGGAANSNGSNINKGMGNIANAIMNSATPNSADTNTNSANGNMTSSTGGDNDFMKKAGQGGMFEVELGKVAESKGTSKDVKEFGAKMVADHSKANDELKAVAAKKDFALPTAISAEQKTDMDDLAKLSGAEFDKKYVEMMVEDHETDVADFQKEAGGGKDADVKAFAAKTLPTLESHLEMIKAIQAKMK